MILNSIQAKELARFNFDIAKGLILGGVGFAIVTPFEFKMLLIAIDSIMAYILVRFALILLREVS